MPVSAPCTMCGALISAGYGRPGSVVALRATSLMLRADATSQLRRGRPHGATTRRRTQRGGAGRARLVPRRETGSEGSGTAAGSASRSPPSRSTPGSGHSGFFLAPFPRGPFHRRANPRAISPAAAPVTPSRRKPGSGAMTLFSRAPIAGSTGQSGGLRAPEECVPPPLIIIVFFLLFYFTAAATTNAHLAPRARPPSVSSSSKAASAASEVRFLARGERKTKIARHRSFAIDL